VPRRVLGDAVRLRQVLVNLVSNAVKFTSRGEVRVTVTRTSLPDGRDGLRLAVRDTGIGIPADRMGRLFQVFSQVDASTTRQYGGTGLGLAICKRLVGLMGGSIGVRSEPGVGSEFYVDLPCEEVPTGPAPLAADANAGPDEQALAYPLLVLLAEDNEINQMVAEHMLVALGYEVAIVDNGQRAIDAVAEARQAGRPFDVVLMDVQMPVLDGLEASRRLVDLYADPAGRPWIIAMTANAMQGDREQCLAAGMDEYLSKPIRAEDLATALRHGHAGLVARRA
jgi:CheY-like chemotaxis protein